MNLHFDGLSAQAYTFESWFRSLFLNIPDGILIITPLKKGIDFSDNEKGFCIN